MNRDKPPSNGVVGVFVFLVFVLVDTASGLEKAFASAMTFGVFAAVLQTKWLSIRDWRFWAVILVFLIPHVVAICFIGFPRPDLAAAFVPVAIVDGFVIWGLINWIEKRFPAGNDAGAPPKSAGR